MFVVDFEAIALRNTKIFVLIFDQSPSTCLGKTIMTVILQEININRYLELSFRKTHSLPILFQSYSIHDKLSYEFSYIN